MKKILQLTFIILSISACNMFSQSINVPKSKKALLMKMTATWCGACGYYHSVTDDIYKQHSDSILFINAHVQTSAVGDPYSGEFHNALNTIVDPATGTVSVDGIPSYNVDGTRQTNWPPQEQSIIDSARKFLKKPVIANVAFKYQITGTQLAVQTSVKFFAADNADEYYVNVFMVENKILTSQFDETSYFSLVQDRISRGPMMSGNAGMWGQKFATGSVSSGAFYDVNFTATLTSTWIQSNMQFVAVVWKKVGTKYSVLSAEDVPSLNTDIENVESSQSDDIKIFPNPVENQMNVSVNGKGNLTVLNTIGQMVLYKDFNTSSDQVISMNTETLNPGVYFLKRIQDDKMGTGKIIIQNTKH